MQFKCISEYFSFVAFLQNNSFIFVYVDIYNDTFIGFILGLFLAILSLPQSPLVTAPSSDGAMTLY